MVGDSTDVRSDFDLKTFLIDIVNALQIGEDGSLMAIALYDTTIKGGWRFSTTQTKQQLVSNIQNIQLTHETNLADKEDVADEVQYLMNSLHGDRDTVPDVVLVINSNILLRNSSNINSHILPVNSFNRSTTVFGGGGGDRRRANAQGSIKIPGNNTIVINIGSNAILTGAFNDQASSHDHVLNTLSYDSLLNFVMVVLNLICS